MHNNPSVSFHVFYHIMKRKGHMYVVNTYLMFGEEEYVKK